MTYTVTMTDETTIARTFASLADVLGYVQSMTCQQSNGAELVSDVLQLGEHIACFAGVWVHVVASRLH
jgi:hypothetical protein